jgi:hypothetical protein
MAITTSAGDGVRVTTAAKNGTLPVQGAITTSQIRFDTTIATNNGNLMVTPTLVGRLVLLRRGLGTEELRYITAIDGTGLIATVNEPWTVIPEDIHEHPITTPKESSLSNIVETQPPTEKDLRVKRALEDLKARTLSVITSVAEQTAALPNTPMRNIQISELVEKEKRVREILDSVQLK